MATMMLDHERAHAISEALIKQCLTGDGHVLNHFAGALMAAYTLALLALAMGSEDTAAEKNRDVFAGMLIDITNDLKALTPDNLTDLRGEFLSLMPSLTKAVN